MTRRQLVQSAVAAGAFGLGSGNAQTGAGTGRDLSKVRPGKPAKITRIEAVLFDSGGPTTGHFAPWVKEILERYGGAIIAPRNLIALRIDTDTGVEGCFVGNSYDRTPAEFEAALRPVLMGEDPFDRERLWMRMYRGAGTSGGENPAHLKQAQQAAVAFADSERPGRGALPLQGSVQIPHRIILSAADIALWDLAGKYTGLPCWELAGGSRDRVKVYVSTHWDFGTPADYAKFALACKKRGYHGVKVHGYYRWDPVEHHAIPARSRVFPEQDVEVLEAMREAVGPDFPLMYDPGYMYNFKQALWVGRRVEKLHLEWFESPMAETDGNIPAYARLCEELTVPVCAPESNEDYQFGRARYMLARATDINRIDHYYGGLTSCLKTAAMCQAAGMRLELHTTATSQYNLQVLGATDEATVVYFEEFVNDLEGENYVGQNPRISSPQGVRSPFLKGTLDVIDRDGYAHIPYTPGAGLDLDWDYIYAHRV